MSPIVGRIMTPSKMSTPKSSEPVSMLLLWPKEHCSHNEVKNLEVRRLFWTIRVDPVESQGSSKESQRRKCDDRSEC